MKQNSVFILLLLTLFSCGEKALPDVIATKSGLFGSREGQFLIKFPKKPEVKSDHFELGSIEFDSYSFTHKLGQIHTYHVSYVDYPEQLLKSWDLEDLFDQNIKAVSSLIDDFEVVSKKVNSEPQYEKSITYILSSRTPGNNTFLKAKLVKSGPRFYMIFFSSFRKQPEISVIDDFLKSFQIYKPT